MKVPAIESQCVMEQSKEARPTMLSLVGLAGLLTDSEDNALLMSLGTSMTLPADGFHSRRSSRRSGQRGLRHARLV